jgi:hypothetical protein
MSDAIPPPPPPPPPSDWSAPQSGYGEFRAGDAIGYGWTKFKQFPGRLILLAIIPAVLGSIVQVVLRLAVGNSGGFFGLIASLLLSVVGFVVIQALSYGVLREVLGVTAGREPTLEDAVNFDRFGTYLLTAILVGIIVAVGFVLLVIPGLIAMFLLWFSTYFALDKGTSPTESIKLSFDLVRKNVAVMLLLALMSIGVILLGFIVCCVGIVVAAPVVYVSHAYAYKRTTGQPVSP